MSEGKLFVGGLPPDTVEEELQTLFAQYGRVVEIFILPARARTGQRCAFVSLGDWASAREAAAQLGGKHVLRPGADPIVVRPKGQPPGAAAGARQRRGRAL